MKLETHTYAQSAHQIINSLQLTFINPRLDEVKILHFMFSILLLEHKIICSQYCSELQYIYATMHMPACTHARELNSFIVSLCSVYLNRAPIVHNHFYICTISVNFYSRLTTARFQIVWWAHLGCIYFEWNIKPNTYTVQQLKNVLW